MEITIIPCYNLEKADSQNCAGQLENGTSISTEDVGAEAQRVSFLSNSYFSQKNGRTYL